MNSPTLQVSNYLSPKDFVDNQDQLTTEPCFKSVLQIKKSPVVNKQSSIESIHKKRNKKSLFWNQDCPLKIIKHHLNRSLEFTKQKQTTEEVRKKAYQFFEKEKNKIAKIQKQGNYLLPKIYAKRHEQFGQGSQEFSIRNNFDVQKRTIKQTHRIQDEKLANQIHQKLKFFRNKCRQEMEKQNITLKTDISKKCFFDLSSQEIAILMNDHSSNDSKAFPTQIDQDIQKRKFVPINIEKQVQIQDNPNIPKFLLKMVEMKNSTYFFDNTIQNCSLFYKKISDKQDLKSTLKIRRKKQNLQKCSSYQNLC